MYPFVRALLAALLAVLMTACATTGPVSSVWTPPNQAPRHYERLVVFGVTNNPKVRRAYEDNFVKQLQTLGVTATAGHELVSDRNLGRLTRLTEGYAKVKADGVLITHLVADETPGARPAARIGSVPDHYRHLVGYFSQVYEEVCAPGYYSDLESLRLETNLYDAKQERLVWSGRSQPLDPSSERTTISQVIEEIVAQMQRDGFLPSR
ncbi:hypothetical protein HW932_15610 [Allochromatium humboldtianum]|uniref:DUF4136 domain-containing protein n=1 Tax=Allochromatium humboldtianum TaxID=504901 RepID=A0A850RIE7_9GAMM|nr:hypothetical protein [Allochromatium humboldtianum]NVZ10690.1 hypothetical protein [Allochromatium humboldtianum]